MIFVAFFNFDRSQKIQPYSLRDPSRHRRSADDYISLFGGGLLLIGVLITATMIHHDASVAPKVTLNKLDWRIGSGSSSTCELDQKAKVDCAAHPENSMLWKSELRRDSPDFLSRFAVSQSDSFWMGVRVPSETLKAAAKLSATTLVLPKMNGVTQVWFDGVYQSTYDPSQQRMPLQIAIPKSRFMDGHELVVTLGVFPYPHQPEPEEATTGQEGFFTALDADRLTRSAVFYATSIHLIAVGLFLLVAGFLWSISSTGRTRDYSVGTQLAVLIALTSLLSVDLSFRIFNVAAYESLYFSLLLTEGLLIARFTFTILRGTRRTSWVEIAVLLAALVLPTALNLYRWIEATGVNLLTAWMLPLIYLACAIATGDRIWKIIRRGSPSSKTRRHSLMLTFLALTLTAVSYFIESRHQSGFHVVWSRWLNLITLLGLIRVFTKSHQTRSSLIELSPASVYHKRELQPEQVSGWIVWIDLLKFSRDRQVISTILSHLWTITQLNDGVVVKSDESSLLIMFENSGGDENQSMIKAIAEMSKCVKDLEQRLPIVFPMHGQSTSILFRAAAQRGSIKPFWHTGETGTSRIPAWLDIENSIEQTRELLNSDLDGALRSNDSSVLVMKETEAESLIQTDAVSSRARIEIDGSSGVVAFIASRLLGRSAKADVKVG